MQWTQALKSYFYQITMLTTYMFISLKKSFYKLNCLLADKTKANMFHLKLAHFRNAVLHFSIYTLFECYTHIFTTLLFQIKRKKVLVYYQDFYEKSQTKFVFYHKLQLLIVLKYSFCIFYILILVFYVFLLYLLL